jgi:hypothetical protein
MEYSRGLFLTKDLFTNDDFVVLINEVRGIVNENSMPPGYPTGEPIDFWDQYVTLTQVISKSVGTSLAVAFALFVSVMFMVTRSDPGTSLLKRLGVVIWQGGLCTATMAMSVYEMYGFMVFANIKISAIPTISIIMATGVAVEMMTYVSMAFLSLPGTRSERVIKALDLMFAPTMDGFILTFLGVFCLAASPFAFIVKYFFYVWCLMLFFCIYNSLVVLPILLSIVGPPAMYSGSGEGGKSKAVVGAA